ncbi:AMP-binding protein [Brevibacterium permense]|uniref:AMP-binding protein n=1 Tax=Brevibacterium permense TaxID=234834 RepID=A0ABN2A7T5_9MICO
MVVTSETEQWQDAVASAVRKARDNQEAIWPSHIPREFPQELANQAFIDVFQERVRQIPNRVAIQFYGTAITYEALDGWSSSIAGWLMQHGVRRGARIGLFMQNCPQFIAVMLGTLKAGAVHVPINPMFKRSELEYETQDSGAEIIVCSTEQLSVVNDSQLPSVREIVPIAIGDLLPESPELQLPKSLQSHTPVESGTPSRWAELVSTELTDPVAVDPHSVAALNYTGGTTGVPKGCMHTQANMLVAAHNCALAWGLIGQEATDAEAVLAFTPIFWISGENNCILAPLFAGATIVLLTRWDPVTALQAIEKFEVTAMSGVVESYLQLLSLTTDAPRQLESLRHLRAMSFSKKLSIDIRRYWESETGGGSVLRESSFGMTESHTSNTFTTTLEIDDYDLKSEPVFVGLPMPGTDVIVVDPSTRYPLPLGDSGEIALRSPSNFIGYWDAPEKTKETLTDGWVFTGDTGRLSSDGTLHYLGRQKEMLKVNGMSVFPSEVEVLMARNPKVEDIGVVGHPDEKTGQSVHAYIRVTPGETTDAQELELWAQENMATYKVPTVHLMESLPKTATGKIRKKDLPNGAIGSTTED